MQAEDDVERALKRLAMVAKDEQKQGGGEVVKYYSERLAKLLLAAEIEFDPAYLKKE